MYNKLIGIFILSIFIFTSSSALAQQNQTDEQGRKQGAWVKYKDGVKFYEGTFKDGKPVGEFLRYHKSGRLSNKSVFDETGTFCRVEFYYDKRKNPLKAKGNYINQIKDSLWIYYNNDGVLVNEEFYKMGVADGMWKLYNYVGGLVKETPYVDGKIHGVQNEYFETGELKRIITFDMDSLHGLFQVNYPNENVRLKGQFNKGMQDGKWYYYKEDESVEFIEYYTEGVLGKRTDEQGQPYELKQEADTTDLGKTPEELMEIR